MKLTRFILLGAWLLDVQGAFAWGQKGHDITACIAECHLKPAAAKKIDRILGGYSPVYYANWLDNASHTPAYAHTKTWHYLNVDEGETFESMPENPAGDVLKAVEQLVRELRSKRLTAGEEQIRLRMLIHLVGDMHCPMHLGHASDLGGNRVSVRFFGRGTNLHTVWDTSLVEAAHNWSYTEWQREIDRLPKREAAAEAAGTPADWVRETQRICTAVYEATPEGTDISYDYVAAQTPVIERQLLRAGLRLARLLNEIYG